MPTGRDPAHPPTIWDVGQGHHADPQLSWSQFSHLLEDSSGMKPLKKREGATGWQPTSGSSSTVGQRHVVSVTLRPVANANGDIISRGLQEQWLDPGQQQKFVYAGDGAN